MAIDTRDKRASTIQFDSPFLSVFPNPDGSLANNPDRQHIDKKYRGIAASGATPSSLIPIILCSSGA